MKYYCITYSIENIFPFELSEMIAEQYILGCLKNYINKNHKIYKFKGWKDHLLKGEIVKITFINNNEIYY